MATPVSGRTSLLAILGDPIAHAQAPRLVNAALVARGADAVLVPMHVAAGDLARALAGLRTIRNFRGAVVTMPHKATALALLDDATPDARRIGACNVVRRETDGRLVGTMLDGEGFVAGLRAAGYDVRGAHVLLAGAGGAAAAIAFALARHGVPALAIHNRTAARAVELAARVQAAHPEIAVRTAAPDARGYDLVVNATSLGMHAGDALPLDVATIAPRTLVADVITGVERTPLLVAAAERGATVHGGRAMLAAQIELMIDWMIGGTDGRP